MPSRPPNHTPRFPGFSSQIPDDVNEIVFLLYGVQAPDAAVAGELASKLRALFEGPHPPDLLDRGSFVDVASQPNTVWMAYWFNRSSFDSWLADPAVVETWDRHDLDGDVGHWREHAVVPKPRLETLYSHPPGFADTSGVSRAFAYDETIYHDYWGAARDRIADSWRDPLAPEVQSYSPDGGVVTRGRRVSVTAPGNACLIRTAQDWSRSLVFRDIYLTEVAPVKDAGVDFLAAHAEAGCISARNIREENREGEPQDRSCTVAWFLSLTDLERWSKSHPTHLAIYASFFHMLKQSDSPLDVTFWHEVSVPSAGSARGNYVNCHHDSGFLRLHSAAPIA